MAVASKALDGLGLTDPVDWVGNAWGGHVGIRLATAERKRLRTLTTIGYPDPAFTLREKWTKGWPLVQLYRLIGPAGFITKTLCDSLLGAEAVAQPDQAAAVMYSFRSADRVGMFHAMRSMILHRAGVEDLLAEIAVPTLVMSVRDDVMGWRPTRPGRPVPRFRTAGRGGRRDRPYFTAAARRGGRRKAPDRVLEHVGMKPRRFAPLIMALAVMLAAGCAQSQAEPNAFTGMVEIGDGQALSSTVRALGRRRCSSFPARAATPKCGTSRCPPTTRSDRRRTT